MDSRRILLVACGKMGVEIVGSVEQWSLIFSFLTCHIKIFSPQNLLISLGVIRDHFSVLDKTFHCCAFCLC